MKPNFIILCAAVFAGHALYASPVSSSVSLDVLVESAIEDDHWLQKNLSLEQAYRNESVAAGQLPDPRLSLALANVPTDSFSFSQEPMTQIVVGVSQSFPRGDTRALSRSRLDLIGDKNPLARQLRQIQLQRSISLVWFDARLAETSIRLIEVDRPVFEQLVDVAESSYRAGTGKVNRQDLIRAQLELTRLEERLLRLAEVSSQKRYKLGEWVVGELLTREFDWQVPGYLEVATFDDHMILEHPEVLLLDQEIAVKRTEGALANESVKPAWSLSSSYSKRDQDRFGNDLSDMFTVGVSLDLPLFRAKRQSRHIAAAADRVAAAESARLLRLQQLKARHSEMQQVVNQLDQQLALYEDNLLDQMQSMAEAALSAYQADESDFADVARAFIALLNARLEAERIETERYKALVELNYLNAANSAEESKS